EVVVANANDPEPAVGKSDGSELGAPDPAVDAGADPADVLALWCGRCISFVYANAPSTTTATKTNTPTTRRCWRRCAWASPSAGLSVAAGRLAGSATMRSALVGSCGSAPGRVADFAGTASSGATGI